MTQQLRNSLTGMVIEAQPGQQTVEIPITWATHVVIPLTQNIAGGLAFAGLYAGAWLGLARHSGWQIERDDLLFWCGLAGAVVACLATVIRFFGDDLGLLSAAYQLGRRSADGQISALVAENQQLQATNRELRGDGRSHKAIEMTEQIGRARRDAENLLSLLYGGQSIARDRSGLPQRSWERAIQLLRAAGCISADGGRAHNNMGQALKALTDYADLDMQRAKDGAWRPKWFVETKRR